MQAGKALTTFDDATCLKDTRDLGQQTVKSCVIPVRLTLVNWASISLPWPMPQWPVLADLVHKALIALDARCK